MTQRYITLPNSRRCGITEYVKSWHELKTLPPCTKVGGFFSSDASADTVLRELMRGVHDRINMRGGLRVSEPAHGRIARLHQLAQLRGRIVIECRECGQPVGHLVNPNSREDRYCAGCRGRNW